MPVEHFVGIVVGLVCRVLCEGLRVCFLLVLFPLQSWLSCQG